MDGMDPSPGVQNILLIESSYEREQVIKEVLRQFNRRLTLQTLYNVFQFSSWLNKMSPTAPYAIILAHPNPRSAAASILSDLTDFPEYPLPPVYILSYDAPAENYITDNHPGVRVLQWSDKASELKANLKVIFENSGVTHSPGPE